MSTKVMLQIKYLFYLESDKNEIQFEIGIQLWTASYMKRIRIILIE